MNKNLIVKDYRTRVIEQDDPLDKSTILLSMEEFYGKNIPYAIFLGLLPTVFFDSNAILAFGQPDFCFPNIAHEVNPFLVDHKFVMEKKEFDPEILKKIYDKQYDILFKKIMMLRCLSNYQSNMYESIVDESKDDIHFTTNRIVLSCNKYQLSNFKIYEYHNMSIVTRVFSYLNRMLKEVETLKYTTSIYELNMVYNINYLKKEESKKGE